jgi:modulator of FtsH protease HflK
MSSNNSWGNPKKISLDAIISQLIEKFGFNKKNNGSSNPNNMGSRLSFLIMGAVILILWLVSGVYKLLPYEQSLVLRFGKWVRTEEPGLRYHLPFPIEAIQKVPTGTIHRMDIGVPSGSQSYPSEEENIMLTGDENILHIGMSLSWQIKDLSKFVLISQDPIETLQVAAESVLRENIGHSKTVPIISRSGWAELNNRIQQGLQILVDKYQIGIRVVNVELHTALAPQPVADSFAEVQRAKTFQEQLINDAHAYANDKIPRARGEQTKIVQAAQAKATQILNLAQGKAKRFEAMYQAYKQDPDLNTKRIYYETIGALLSQNKNKQIFDKSFAKNGLVPYMNINATKPAKEKEVQ